MSAKVDFFSEINKKEGVIRNEKELKNLMVKEFQEKEKEKELINTIEGWFKNTTFTTQKKNKNKNRFKQKLRSFWIKDKPQFENHRDSPRLFIFIFIYRADISNTSHIKTSATHVLYEYE